VFELFNDKAILAAEERMANEVCHGYRHFASGRCALLSDTHAAKVETSLPQVASPS